MLLRKVASGFFSARLLPNEKKFFLVFSLVYALHGTCGKLAEVFLQLSRRVALDRAHSHSALVTFVLQHAEVDFSTPTSCFRFKCLHR